MEKEFIPDYSGTEHKAWIEMFNEASRVFYVSREKLNEVKYRVFFKLIERWAWADRERRKEVDPNDNYKGCLWDGEEIKGE